MIGLRDSLSRRDGKPNHEQYPDSTEEETDLVHSESWSRSTAEPELNSGLLALVLCKLSTHKAASPLLKFKPVAVTL